MAITSSGTLASTGVGSGLDVNTIVSKLMAVEQQPITTLNNRETALQAKISAYGTINSSLSSLQAAMSALTVPSNFIAVKANIGDTTVISGSASASAQPGSFSIEVTALAQAQKVTSTGFTAITDSAGSGALTFQFGTYATGSFTANADKAAQTVTVPTGSSSLSGVRDAINSANISVTASIVNDGTTNRLVITSTETGVANALKISVIDDDSTNTNTSGLSRLAYDASLGGATNMTESVAAKNSQMIVDGMTISKATNTISDAVPGVTLNLLKTNLDAPTTLTVTKDQSAASTAVANFVKAWNSSTSALRSMGAYNAVTKTGAVLQGDTTLLSIQSRLRNLINKPLSPPVGGLSTLSDIGVSFQTDGTLTINATKLNAVLADSGKDISTLFATVGKSSDSLISFSSATSAASSGTYAVSVGKLATTGKMSGDTPAGLTISAGVNDRLNLTVDGLAASITLSPGTYSANSLAAELQSRINGAGELSAKGSAVTVNQSSGVLTITSNRYGSASNVSVSGDAAAASLFGITTTTAGVDVEGSIDGANATGSGQSLTASNITLKISGGSLGSRGTITYGQGYASQVGTLLTGLIGTGGPLDTRVAGLNISVKDIGKRRSALNLHLIDVEKNYRAQFTALDSTMSSMTATSTYLTQQLASLATLK